MSSPATAWTCPVCGRRVPRGVEECFCGIKRAQAERAAAPRQAPSELRAARRGFGHDALLILGAAVVLGLAAGIWSRRDAPQPPPTPAVPAAAPAAAPPAAPRALEPAPAAEPYEPPAVEPDPFPAEETVAEEPASGAEPGGPAAAVPQPAPTSEPSPALSGVDEARKRGLQQLERDLGALSGAVQQLDQRVAFYESQCVGPHYGSTVVVNCDDIERGITKLADQVSAAVETVLDRARQSWLEQRTIQDAREQAGVDAATVDGLLARARRVR
ncbi:MAG: hypothetical protein AB7O37_08120 [Vicinamibacteria bacterium]